MFPKDLWAHLQNECNVYCYFFLIFFFAVCYLFSSNIIITVHVSFLDLWFAKNKTEKCSCVHSVLLELLKLLIRGILTLFEMWKLLPQLHLFTALYRLRRWPTTDPKLLF